MASVDRTPERVMVIGLDAAIASRVYEYAMSGLLPTIRKLIENGVYAENCLVPYPTITPPNWTTIVTGAWPGTHGITCFNVHNPGDPLDETHPAVSTDCNAEYIWNAAEKVGKKTILINYPSTWPPTLKDGVQIGGAGLSMNDWRTEVFKGPNVKYTWACTLADNQFFSTEMYPLATQIHLKEASGWKGLSSSNPSLEAQLNLRYRNARFKMKRQVWYLLVQDTEGKGYDTVILSKSKDASEAFASLKVGEWSKVITDVFETERGPMEGLFRCKLMELTKDAKKLTLYVTAICASDGWSHPPSVARELKSEEGLPYPLNGTFQAYNMGWIDLETLVEVMRLAYKWLADASTYLLKKYPWDLFFMHVHSPDWIYHSFSKKIDPSITKDAEEVAQYKNIEIRTYQIIDEMMQRIISCADDKTLMIVTSDHGAKASISRFQVGHILEEAGFTVFKESGETGRREIDWSKTKAIAQRSSYIYINVKGRDPHGIVEPGEEYEMIRNQVINALYDYTDPETGIKPIALALKREDARIIGLYGDTIGDIVYALNPEFGGSHGPFLPTAGRGVGSLKGLLIMSGPGVKKNYILKRTAWLTDITPTICYLMEIPIPKDTEGSILYQALENPNRQLEELKQLRKNYSRLKRAFERDQDLTHTYNEAI